MATPLRQGGTIIDPKGHPGNRIPVHGEEKRKGKVLSVLNSFYTTP